MNNTPLEADEQAAIVKYCRLRNIPVVASMNGTFIPGKNRFAIAAKMKKAGMATGFPDLFIPVALKGRHGLFLEIKRVKGSDLSEKQADWIKRLNGEGYFAIVVYGFDEAKKVIDEYVGMRI